MSLYLLWLVEEPNVKVTLRSHPTACFSYGFCWPAMFLLFFHSAVLVVLFSVYSFDLLWFIYGFIMTSGITGCISSESLDAQALVKLFFQGDSGLVFC